MTPEWDAARVAQRIAELGPWVDHNICLGHGIWTRGEAGGLNVKIRRVMEVVATLVGSIQGRTILDLGCLEGGYALEAALRGARVVGIDGREANIGKCDFAKEVLALRNADFRVGDVRGLSREQDGTFDLVLCMGLLYHLDDPFSFLKTMSLMCEGYLILDTHISYLDRDHGLVRRDLRSRLSRLRRLILGGEVFEGRMFTEFKEGVSVGEKVASLQSALDNDQSFWPTKASLEKMLALAGFTAVWEALRFSDGGSWSSSDFPRVLLIAVRNATVSPTPLWG